MFGKRGGSTAAGVGREVRVTCAEFSSPNTFGESPRNSIFSSRGSTAPVEIGLTPATLWAIPEDQTPFQRSVPRFKTLPVRHRAIPVYRVAILHSRKILCGNSLKL